MLTFTFTGVDGTMTECETLTSGMVGKQVLLIFDESWDQLHKTVVFRAGDLNRVVIDASSTVTIPEAVLARPFGRLFVGVYGTDAAGTVVIPTIMAEGPMIRYGADPIEDETAKELPVWQDLQNQIGNLTELETENQENLTGAVNELHRRESALASDVEQIQASVAYLGEPLSLETQNKTSLVDAINEIHREVDHLTGNYVAFTPQTVQRLVDILLEANYKSDQEENIAALAEALGATLPEKEIPLIYHWDFRTGSLTDLVAGVDATASANVTLDTAGAHIAVKNSYIMLPAGPDGTTLSGKVLEIKFGPMTLDESASTMRLVLSSAGTQPATVGLQWNSKGCWANSSSATTEFTDRQMFSNKVLTARGAADSNQIDWYLEGTLLCTTNPSFVPSHISLGSSMSGAFPMLVEYVKIYPDL